MLDLNDKLRLRHIDDNVVRIVNALEKLVIYQKSRPLTSLENSVLADIFSGNKILEKEGDTDERKED